jgi:tetratricopeptide (TPR) repeat protein
MNLIRKALLFVFFLSIHTLFGQEWQVLDSLCFKYREINPDTAIVFGKKALELCFKEKGTKSFEYGRCLNTLGLAYNERGDFSISDSLFNLAIKTIKRQSEKKDMYFFTGIMLNLANLYRKQGLYKQAEQLYKEVIDIRKIEFGKNSEEYPSACHILANLYRVQGRYSEAEILYKEAIEITRKISPNHINMAIYSNSLAVLCVEQGRMEEAEYLFSKEVIPVHEAKMGKNNPQYATVYANFASIYRHKGQYAKAESLIKEAIIILDNLTKSKIHTHGTMYNNLGFLYLEQKKYVQAESLFLQAREIRKKLLGVNHSYYAQSNNNLAGLYQYTGRYSKAESLFLSSKNYYSLFMGKESSSYIMACGNIGELYLIQRRYKDAKPHIFELQALIPKQIDQNFITLSEIEKEQYFKNNLEARINTFFKFLVWAKNTDEDFAESGYNLTIQTKGLMLNNNEKIKNRILSSNNQQLKKLYLEWKNSKEKYVKSQEMSSEQKKQKFNTDSLSKRTNELEKQLSLLSEDFAGAFTPKQVKCQDIQKKLLPNEAAIEM